MTTSLHVSPLPSTSKNAYQEISISDPTEIQENVSDRSSAPHKSHISLPKIPSFASFNFFSESTFMKNSPKKCTGAFLEGPRRVLKLCLFGLLLPVFLISVPLYVRLVLYPPIHYMMASTDQRLLGRSSSNIWCQSQTVHMNGSFNAFLISAKPRPRNQLSVHSMFHHLTLKDDVKEYWGFFMQKGSIVTINLCNRYDGGMLMIMRGAHNLKKCAWIGEEDSAEQDEDHKETSNESGQGDDELTTELLMPGQILMEIDQKDTSWQEPQETDLRSAANVNLTSEERKEELDFYINKLFALSKTPKEIIDGLTKHKLKLSTKNVRVNETDNSKKKSKKIKAKKKSKKRGSKKGQAEIERENKLIRMKRYLSDSSENIGEVEISNDHPNYIRESILLNAQNSSYEVSNNTREAYISLFDLPSDLTHDRGIFNQTNAHDKSNEEHRSSFSSSEEALTKCEGVIGVMPLYPSRECHGIKDSHINKVKYRIPKTATYYFVFSSDNEVFDSDIYLNLTLERVVFDTESARESCVNKTECSFALSFWSHDQAVVEVPEHDWNAAYDMEIKCQPRVALYLIFIFLVPIILLFCAYR